MTIKKCLWGIGLPRNIQRAHIDFGGKTVVTFELRPDLGLYSSNIAAKRAYLEGLEPDLIGCDDNFIRLHWRYCVNMGTAKIIKVEPCDRRSTESTITQTKTFLNNVIIDSIVGTIESTELERKQMTYFPIPANQSTCKVSEWRSALSFAEHCLRKADHPGCRIDEIIQERSHALLCLFRAMRDLHSLSCSRLSSEDKANYSALLNSTIAVVDEHKNEYFEPDFEPSSMMTDYDLSQAWHGSRKADQLTYLKDPINYPAQAIAVINELRGIPLPSNVIAFPSKAL
jgi:hypothetical protein